METGGQSGCGKGWHGPTRRGRGRESLKGVMDKNMAHLKVARTADLTFRTVDLSLRADFPQVLRASSYWAEGWSPPEPPL